MTQHQNVDGSYLESRKLQKSAGWMLLWAMGVGAVISGDFFGWNAGLAYGRFSGLLVATLAMAAMYVCLVFSIAELTSALPHAGGFYSFVRSALGPTAGYVCGVTDTIEYVLTPATIVVAIGAYLGALIPGVPPWIWWLVAYALFTAINIRGVALTLQLGLAVTLVAVLALAVFYVAALATGAFRWELLWNIPAGSDAQGAGSLALGVFAALPFGAWFYLAIEQLPLAAEEAHDVVRDIPRALVLGIATLLVLSLLTLVLNTGVGGGAVEMQKSAAPLADGVQAAFGSGPAATLLTLGSLAGLVASFHALIYAYGRVLFALSRAGYFPRWISVTSRWCTPHRALLLGSAVGLGCAILVAWTEGSQVGAALLVLSVAGAVVSYILVLASFLWLRWRRPDLPRPYRSPLGVPGAVTGLLLAVAVFAACFAVRAYRDAMLGVIAFLVLAVLYFLFYSRHRLVAQAPEEAAALATGAARDPG